MGRTTLGDTRKGLTLGTEACTINRGAWGPALDCLLFHCQGPRLGQPPPGVSWATISLPLPPVPGADYVKSAPSPMSLATATPQLPQGRRQHLPALLCWVVVDHVDDAAGWVERGAG